MGLYEDSVPDSYSCYICRDPPGERLELPQNHLSLVYINFHFEIHLSGLCVIKQDKNYKQNTTTTSMHFVVWLFVNV